MTTKTLDRIEAETQRFLQRLAVVRQIEQENEDRTRKAHTQEMKYAYQTSGTRKHGALRRSAHDLKEILTFITQNKDIEDGK
ncbi:hypothetical protein D3C87_1851590 [compost metagenome]